MLLLFFFAFSLVILVLAWIYIPRNKKFPHLDESLPKIKINKVYYINMDESVDRKERFLRNYNGSMDLERIAGVKVYKQIGKLGVGTRGCALAHAKAMNEVALSPDGWYLICEDDCVGNFNAVENNTIVKNILHRTAKQFINLGRYKSSPYSLTDINLCLQAYMLTPQCATKTRDAILANIDSPQAMAVDELVVSLYRTPRFYGQSGDGSGCHVALFEAEGESVITSEGR